MLFNWIHLMAMLKPPLAITIVASMAKMAILAIMAIMAIFVILKVAIGVINMDIMGIQFKSITN